MEDRIIHEDCVRPDYQYAAVSTGCLGVSVIFTLHKHQGGSSKDLWGPTCVGPSVMRSHQVNSPELDALRDLHTPMYHETVHRCGILNRFTHPDNQLASLTTTLSLKITHLVFEERRKRTPPGPSITCVHFAPIKLCQNAPGSGACNHGRKFCLSLTSAGT